MVTFDKLKIVAGIEAVKITDESRFEIIRKKGLITSRKYYQETPFLLRIKMDYKRRESVIEFSGKILGRDYPKLISSDTIKLCFENINALGFCSLDTSMMMDADVVKCDVTLDKTLSDFKQATDYIRSHICSYQKFICRKLLNGNVTIEKNVVSSKSKKRLTIYDKEQEMMRTASRINDQAMEQFKAKGAKRAKDGAFRHMAEHDDGIKVPDESFDVRHR